MLKRKGVHYPSDLTDAEWKILQLLFPEPAKLGLDRVGAASLNQRRSGHLGTFHVRV